jgi:hypothetical protein
MPGQSPASMGIDCRIMLNLSRFVNGQLTAVWLSYKIRSEANFNKGKDMQTNKPHCKLCKGRLELERA